MKRGHRGVLLVVVLAAAVTFGCARNARILSEFGSLYDGEGKYRSEGAHMGVDVWGHPGDPVLAAADGRASVVGEFPAVAGQATCGKYIILDHEEPLTIKDVHFRAGTMYCHLSQHTIVEGTAVKRGQVIGYIGTTGWRRQPTSATGYEHVHWELMASGGRTDPLSATAGCFDPKQTYPTDRLVLTWPVKC